MTSFNAQTGNGVYLLQFETDSEEKFLAMQECARACIDNRLNDCRWAGWHSVKDSMPGGNDNVIVRWLRPFPNHPLETNKGRLKRRRK